MPQSTYAVPVLFANQAADLGAEFQYILGDAVYDEHLLTEAGANMEGAVCAMGVYDNSPEFDTYKEEFAKNHPGNSANMYALYAVDFITFLEWAVNDRGSLDRAAIRDSLESATSIELFTDSDFTMDPATHNPLNKTVNVVQIQDSQYVMLESFKPE